MPMVAGCLVLDAFKHVHRQIPSTGMQFIRFQLQGLIMLDFW